VVQTVASSPAAAAEPLNLNRLTTVPVPASSGAGDGVIRTPGRSETSWEQAFYHQQQVRYNCVM